MSIPFEGLTIDVSYPAIGQIECTTPGTYTWTIPAGVYNTQALELLMNK
jgi:hypothetical protein